MSWDKNTVNFSEIEATKDVLDNLGETYQESIIATFRPCGLNDDYMGISSRNLRRLQYKNKVILEYVEVDADCDVDDVILSQQFDLQDEPTDWQAIRKTDKTGQYPNYVDKG